FEGKRVVVLGMGNSAMDIAVETSYQAEKVFLAARRGAHIVPKYAMGKPIDTLMLPPWVPIGVSFAVFPAMLPVVPWPVRRCRLFRAMLRVVQGPVERYGLPTPDHVLGHAPPTVSADILSRVAHGAVVPRPNIAELLGDSVRFADGSVEPVDAIIYCTGYRV